jgi:hypothetical protein
MEVVLVHNGNAMGAMSDKACLNDLGCEPGASFEQAKKAYRALAMKCHPDRVSGAQAEERFKKISTSFERLRLRQEEGRWSSPWDGERAPALDARGPIPPKRRWSAPSSWNSEIEGPYSFDYLPSGSVQEIARAFFASYARALDQAASRAFKSKDDSAQIMARAYLKLFAKYAPGMGDEDVAAMACVFGRALWEREAPGILEMAEKAWRRAGAMVASDANLVADGVSPLWAWRDAAGAVAAFSMLDEIAKKRPWNPRAASFHQEAAARFKQLAPIERLDERRSGSSEPFALRLARERPELFEIYDQAGWFDWSNKVYQSGSVADELAGCALPWPAKAKALWKIWGLSECAKRLNAMDPKTAREAALAWSEHFVRENGVDEVDPCRQTVDMRRHSPARKAFWALHRKVDPALGRLGLRLRSKWGKPGDPARRAFSAVAARDPQALREALAQAKALGEPAPELDGVSLATFAAWSEAFAPRSRTIAREAFEAAREFFGEQAMGHGSGAWRSGEQWEPALARQRRQGVGR